MKNVILFDNEVRERLLPLTFTRPVAELRVGILTIKEKWQRWMGNHISYITQDYLSQKYPIRIDDHNYVINASALPSERLYRLITQLEENEALLQDDELIATRLNRSQFERLINDEEIEELAGFDLEDTPYLKINNLWDIFTLNDAAIQEDFKLITKDRISQPLSDTNKVIGSHPVFLEEGAFVECATLNTTNGPIYVGKNATIMEGSMIRGSVALCESAQLKLGTKVYGATTIGPFSKIGGEVNNIVVTGYSSKAHDGFLGNAVLGEWCNLGADTNCSNLKNNYGEVRLWDYTSESFLPTGQQFFGLIMGDHSKCGINTMFNTGTIVGVFANIFGAGYPRNFVPSFSWGGTSGFQTYKTAKAFETAERVFARRNQTFGEEDKTILSSIFEETSKYRRWEKIILQ